MKTECIYCQSKLDKGVYIYNYKGVDLHFCPVQQGPCLREWVKKERQGLNFCYQCHGLFMEDGEISVFEHKWFCCKQHRKEYADGQT